MKIKLNQSNNIKSSISNSMEFGIRSENMGLILDILRSKMYKDPINSICREISTNSRDANIENNKRSHPVEISIDEDLFNENELTSSFKDFGKGIDPDRMENIFMQYGSSTKRATNSQAGGFGLGAKTPFAYSDTFYIRTISNGNEYIYVAAIENNDCGKMFCMVENKTSEKSGTTITIPIKNADRCSFEKCVYTNTIFWKQ
ncbi:MAG: ATP-binding protein, partial [bacterium]